MTEGHRCKGVIVQLSVGGIWRNEFECQDGGRDPTWAMTRRPKLEKPRQPTQPAAALPIATFHGR